MRPVIPAGAPPDLDQLRGLHLPTGNASLLQGEIVAAAALGFLAALLVVLVHHLRQRAEKTIRREALYELTITRSLEPNERLVAQARLLRRLARTLNGDDSVRKQGIDWAAELDSLFSTDFFTKGAGRALIANLYRRQTPDVDAIDVRLAQLFGQIRK